MDTEQEPTFRYWVELPEAEPVKFGVLPTLMARALHSDAFAQAGAEINFEEALGRMVDAGTLKVRDPLTLERHTFPIREALRRAVLLPHEDVGPLLASFQIGLRLIHFGTGPRYWTIENAAAAFAAQEGWHQGARATLQAQMVTAATDGTLKARQPQTGIAYRPVRARDFYELVTPADVNAWFARDPILSLHWKAGEDQAVPVTEPVAPGEEWPLKKAQREEGKSPPLEHWKMRVQAEAADEWRRLRAMNCNPTRASIRPHLLKWCKQNNVKTGGGINPSDGYLRTHVLSGKHWAPPTE